MADRQDTLDLLQRDSRTLERALNNNGFRMDKGSLNFSLRQDNPSYRDNGANGGSQNMSSNTHYGNDEDVADITPVRARIIDPSRIDIWI